MYLATDDTICAIASAPGGAARGIVRVAGAGAIAVAGDCFHTDDRSLQLDQLRRPSAIAGQLCVSAFSSPIPCTLYVWPSKRSYTKSPMAELHTIGSPPVLEAILQTLCEGDARLAQPGEFTMRAFLAGRLDLTQAEAVLGVIDADDDRQLGVALRQLAGGLAGPLGEVRESLLNLLAELEAGLDFVEEDIEFISADQLCTQLASAEHIVSTIQRQIGTRADTQSLARVTLVGLANVGKSTLFNEIVERTGATDHAAPSIVSSEPGTTRDYRTATINTGGIAWQLIDTAGVLATAQPDAPTAAAQLATHQQRRDADLRVLCIDASRPPEQWEIEQLDSHSDDYAMIVHTKLDIAISEPTPQTHVAISATTGHGMDDLTARIATLVVESQRASGDAVASTAARCRESLAQVAQCLAAAQALTSNGGGHELVAAELRIALDQLGQVVGAVYTDDILDRIFSRFCIGK